MSEVRRVIRISPDALYRDLQGEGILLQLETGQYFGLDEVGHRIWQHIVQNGDLALVQEALASEYGSPETLSADLDRFVAQLVEKKLVQVETIASRT